jgi:hypothetical protein
MGNFYRYFSALWPYWWWFLTSGPYVVDPLLESMFESYHWWKVGHFSIKTWQRAKGVLALTGIFFAGFFAWRDEHLALEQARKETVEARESTRISPLSEAEITARVNKLVEERLRPRTLTDNQKKKLTEALSNVPSGEMYQLYMQISSSCNGCSIYTEDMLVAWNAAPGWKTQLNTQFGWNPRFDGVIFGFDLSKCPSDEVRLIKEALKSAGIDHEVHAFSEEEKKSISAPCGIFVGNRPQK